MTIAQYHYTECRDAFVSPSQEIINPNCSRISLTPNYNAHRQRHGIMLLSISTLNTQA